MTLTKNRGIPITPDTLSFYYPVKLPYSLFRVLCAEYRRACHENVAPGFFQQTCVFKVHASVYLDGVAIALFRPYTGQLSYLSLGRRNKALSAEARVHAHYEDQVAIRQYALKGRNRRCRIYGDSRLNAVRLYELKGSATAPVIKVAEPAGKVVVAGNNTVRLSFTYTSKEGDPNAKLYVTTAAFQGVANVSPSTGGFAVVNENAFNAEGQLVAGTYTLNNSFAIDSESYTAYGNVNLSIVSAVVTPAAGGEAVTVNRNGRLTLAAGDSVVFNISEYTDRNTGDVVDDAQTTAYRVVAAPEPEEP